MTDNPSPNRRKWWSIAAWFMVSIFTLLLLTLGGTAWWLWGWKCNDELSFHESWTPAERAALTEFNTYLLTQLPNDLESVMTGIAETTETLNNNLPVGEIPAAPSGFSARIVSAVVLRLHIAPLVAALQEISASGKGDPQEPVSTPAANKTTPAILAAQTANLPALKALIAHGADPNAIAVLEQNGRMTELETPITPLISGAFINGRRLPWEERRETLDFMIGHGADLNSARKIIGTSLQLALYLSDDTKIWLWAIEHGRQLGIAEFKFLLGSGHPSRTELVEHILSRKLINVNDISDDETALQFLAMRMTMADVEEIEQGSYEKELDLLLSAGADPYLTTSTTHRTPLNILTGRTNFERADGMPENSCCMESPDIRTRWVMLCDKLRAAGANNFSPAPIDEEEEDEPTDEDDGEEETYESDGEEEPADEDDEKLLAPQEDDEEEDI